MLRITTHIHEQTYTFREFFEIGFILWNIREIKGRIAVNMNTDSQVIQKC